MGHTRQRWLLKEENTRGEQTRMNYPVENKVKSMAFETDDKIDMEIK